MRGKGLPVVVSMILTSLEILTMARRDRDRNEDMVWSVEGEVGVVLMLSCQHRNPRHRIYHADLLSHENLIIESSLSRNGPEYILQGFHLVNNKIMNIDNITKQCLTTPPVCPHCPDWSLLNQPIKVPL